TEMTASRFIAWQACARPCDAPMPWPAFARNGARRTSARSSAAPAAAAAAAAEAAELRAAHAGRWLELRTACHRLLDTHDHRGAGLELVAHHLGESPVRDSGQHLHRDRLAVLELVDRARL